MDEKKKLLIIDDDFQFVESITMVLEDAGFEVTHAKNGIEGIESAKASKPDLIIHDVLMPKQDGLTTFEDLIKNEGLKDIPVVMLTNVNQKLGFGVSSEDMSVHYGKEPAAFLTKAADPMQLISTLKRILK